MTIGDTLRIGSHLSIAKGLPKAAAMAQEIRANTFQFFTRNPRGGSARAIPGTEINKWLQVRKELDLFPIVGHLPYTVNLAAPKEETRSFARMVLAEDLERMNAIGAEFLVVHPGSHAGEGKEAGRRRILATLMEAFLPFSGASCLLLETMAGQGSEVGALEDLEFFLTELGHPSNLGICLDTCHIFAAGYDLCQKGEVDRLLEEIDKRVGLERLKAVHLNDSKTPAGSRRDRHERIGRGYLGREGIMNVITHPDLAHLPFLLETPVAGYKEYGEEIDLIKEWLTAA
ncbi:MAG: deoxyribonuclease IV [bacterium]